LSSVVSQADALARMATAGKPITPAQIAKNRPLDALFKLRQAIDRLASAEAIGIPAHRTAPELERRALDQVVGWYRLTVHQALAGLLTGQSSQAVQARARAGVGAPYSQQALERLHAQASKVMTSAGDADLLARLTQRLSQQAAQPPMMLAAPGERPVDSRTGTVAATGAAAGEVARRQLEDEARRLKQAREQLWRERKTQLPGAGPDAVEEAVAQRNGVSVDQLRAARSQVTDGEPGGVRASAASGIGSVGIGAGHRIVVIDQTTNHEKEVFFRRLFGSVNTSFLPLIQQPAPDEIAMSAKGNAKAKAEHASRTSVPAPLLLADIAGARGILPPELLAALHDFVTFGLVVSHRTEMRPAGAVRALETFLQAHGAAPSEAAWWEFLEKAARMHGQQAAWDALRASPVFVFTDDSKTQAYIHGPDGKERPLSFRDLDTAVRAVAARGASAEEEPLIELHRAVQAVASTLKATRAHGAVDQGQTPEAPYKDEDAALRWYLDLLGNHGVLGPDGSPIASLMEPLRLLQALDVLARFEGQAGLQDIKIRGMSVVSATPLLAPKGFEFESPSGSLQATGYEDFRFRPLEDARRRLEAGEPVSLPHVLMPTHGGGRSVAELLEHGQPEDLLQLSRGEAMKRLVEQLRESGLHMPQLGDGPHLPPLNASDRIAVVVPDAADSAFRARLTDQIMQAWHADAQAQPPAARPQIEFHPLSAMDDPTTNAQVRGASVSYFVSPDLVPGADGPEAKRSFSLGLLSDAIDATVGPAALRGNPSFVLIDPERPDSTGMQARALLRGLYNGGEVPHPLPAAFVPFNDNAIAQAAQQFWSRATTRPRTVSIEPRSVPLDLPAAAAQPQTAPLLDHRVVDPAATPRAGPQRADSPLLAPVRVALFGSAAEQPKPGVVASTHRVMSEFIRAMARRDAGQSEPPRHRIALRGAALHAVAQQVLAVARPAVDSTRDIRYGDYLRRVEAALRAMPAVDVTVRSAAPDDPVFEIDVPEMRRAVVAVHGAGRSRHPMRSPFDPVRTVMDGFNLVHPLADGSGQLRWVGSDGITTPELALLEGTPPPQARPTCCRARTFRSLRA
jgi:hypothetical protein